MPGCCLADLGLDHSRPEDFMAPRWKMSQGAFVAYRIIAMILFLAWLVASGLWNYNWYSRPENAVLWFIYLTNWNILLQAIVAVMQAAVSVYYLRKKGKATAMTSMPIYLRILWVLYNVSMPTALIITVGYWSMDFVAGRFPLSSDILNHVLNTVYVLLDLSLTAIPIRIQHFFHPMLYGLIYYVFTAIYTLSGGHNALDQPYVYSILDWRNSPGKGVILPLIHVIVAAPFAHAVLFGLYHAREAVYKRWFMGEGIPDQSNDGVEYSRLDSNREGSEMPLVGQSMPEDTPGS